MNEREAPLVGAVTVALMLLFAWLCSGCARNKPLAVVITNPLQVKVENEREKPSSCYAIESMPEAPTEISNLMEEDDIVRRVFVHIRQYNEMVQFAHDITMWGQSVALCLEDLTEKL